MKTYGILDLAFAALYLWLGFWVVPGRSTAFNLALFSVSLLLALAGAGLVAGARWGRTVAIVASSVLLAFAAAALVGMVASSAYLRGVYGPLGRGMALLCLVIAAVVVELFALLPLFQLRFLLGRARG
jgi:hypothetical protein